MEPIALIVTALVAGAAAVANDVGGQALKDAYNGVKTLIIDRYKAAQGVVELAESKPESEDLAQAAQQALAGAGAENDGELLALAEQLQALLDKQEAAEPGSTTINVSGSGAVATGGGVAAGEGGIAVGGNVTGNVSAGSSKPKDQK